MATEFTKSRADRSSGYDFQTAPPQTAKQVGFSDSTLWGQNGLASPCRGHASWSCKQAKSEKGAAAHSVLVPPHHDVSAELRDIRREHGETTTLVCCPVKVCLFWPECT